KVPPVSTSAYTAPFYDTWQAFFKLLILTHGGSYAIMVYLSPSRSRQEALSNNTSFEYEQTCVTAVGSVSSPFSQLKNLLVTSNILKIADFGLAGEVASVPPQKCRTSLSAMSASLPAHPSA
ncbi:hypothetical protein HID58_055526, partial [Brassica napus]